MIISTSQQPVFKEIKENKECILDVLDQTKDSDWVLTPEGSLSGYCKNQIHEKNSSEYGPALQEVENYLIKNKRNMLLATGHVESNGLPYNQIRVYKEGQFQGAYAKQLLTNDLDAAGELFYYVAGNEPHYYYLDSDQKVIASSLICNDIWAFPRMSPKGNPYFYRDFRKYNVKVVFCSVNCNIDYLDPLVYDWHETHLRLFSREFEMYTVVSGAATDMRGEPVNHIQCPSGIIGPDGEWITKCKDTGMDIATADLKL
tara:strand:+ start:1766 stop:2539 length:774 start_codon:yes stop_codon:yes gene_type:complete